MTGLMFNVLDYGGRLDGSSDNREALRLAAAAATAAGGGTVYMPRGFVVDLRTTTRARKLTRKKRKQRRIRAAADLSRRSVEAGRVERLLEAKLRKKILGDV